MGAGALRTVEELLAEIQRLQRDEQVRLARMLIARLTPADPSKLWNDWDDPEVDKAYVRDGH